jgi:hypothetical protein
MFGSAHGLIPRSVRNIGAPILIGVALVGFLIWRFGPDLYSNMRSNAAPWFATSAPASNGQSPARPAPAAAPAPHQSKPAAPAVQGIVIREVVSAPAPEPAPTVIVAVPVEDAASKPAEQSSSDGSAYDSGVKRAAKSVGRLLHIGGKKKDQAPQ